MEPQINSYFERKEIPQLLESLITGLSYNRPEDPVAYLQECLEQIKKNPDAQKWDSFVDKNAQKSTGIPKTSPADISALNKAAVAAASDMADHQKQQLESQSQKSGTSEKSQASAKKSVAKSPDAVNAVFVLGGPGSGKGTQCANIVNEFGWSHVSVGDLLRAEVAAQSAIGQQIDSMMKEGQIVPLNIVLSVLKNALSKMPSDKGILIDGFPREMPQVEEFEKTIGKVRFALYFECSEAVMESRLLKRAETSGRSDDNIETIKKRFKTFVQQSLPVTEYFAKDNRLVRISAEQAPEEVYQQARSHFQ